MDRTSAYRVFSGLVLLCSLLISNGCNRPSISKSRAEGEVFVRAIHELNRNRTEVCEKSDVVAAGIILGEWKYTKIDEKAFMLAKPYRVRSYLVYRSDVPGKFGKGWCVQDDNGNTEWLP